MAKDADYIRLIHTARWQRLRRAVLSRHPLCQDCEAAGRVAPAEQVHHVEPVESALTFSGKAALMFDPANLRALCAACHAAAHERLGGRGTREANRRRQAAHAADAIRKLYGDDPGAADAATPPGGVF